MTAPTIIKHMATDDLIFNILQGDSLKHGFNSIRLLLVLGRVAISDRQCVANSDIPQQ